MRTLALFCLVAATTVSANSQTNWSEPVPLTAGTSDDIHPVISNGGLIFFMGGGEEMLAFSHKGKDICVLRTTGGGAAWSDSVTRVTTDSADNDCASLFYEVDQGMLVWQSLRNGNLDIYFSRYVTGSWSVPQPVAVTSEDDRYPHVTHTSDHRYYVVWEQRGRIVFSEYSGTAWSTPAFITPPGDTLNHLPQAGVINFPTLCQPLVIWERRKEADTTCAIMYADRNGTVWTSPDTLVYTGDNRRPRFFKYNDPSDCVQWERRVGNSSVCYAGSGGMIGTRFVLHYATPVTVDPDNQRNPSVRMGIYYTSLPGSPPALFWPAIATWESRGGPVDSIGAYGQAMSSSQKLSPAGAISNRNPDISCGTMVGSNPSVIRFWIVWEANVSGMWRLFASNKIIVVDAVDQTVYQPDAFEVEQNYPNPFNPTTKIGFQVTGYGLVSLKVYDVLGREVATLVNEELSPGRYERTFDGSTMASGIYWYRLSVVPLARRDLAPTEGRNGQTEEFVQTRKLVLLR